MPRVQSPGRAHSLPRPLRAAGHSSHARSLFAPAATIASDIRRVGEAGDSAWTPFILLVEALVIVAPAAILIAVLTYAAYVAG